MATTYEATDEKYLLTIKELRSRNFTRNLPFLLLSDELPEGQVYREYPDGHIELQQVFITEKKYQYKPLRILSSLEADKVRQVHGLY